MKKGEVLAKQLIRTLDKIKKEKGEDRWTVSIGNCEKHGDVECKKYGQAWRCVHCGRIVK